MTTSRDRGPRRRARRVAGAAMALGLTAVLAGCGGSSDGAQRTTAGQDAPTPTNSGDKPATTLEVERTTTTIGECPNPPATLPHTTVSHPYVPPPSVPKSNEGSGEPETVPQQKVDDAVAIVQAAEPLKGERWTGQEPAHVSLWGPHDGHPIGVVLTYVFEQPTAVTTAYGLPAAGTEDDETNGDPRPKLSPVSKDDPQFLRAMSVTVFVDLKADAVSFLRPFLYDVTKPGQAC